jgi:hypothetical protein
MRLTSVSAILRLWLAEPCLSTNLLSVDPQQIACLCRPIQIALYPPCPRCLLVRPTTIGVIKFFFCIIWFRFSSYHWVSCLSLVGGGTFTPGTCYLRFLDIMSTCMSCPVSSARRLIGGVVVLLVHDQMNIMFTARKPKSYSIVIPCLTELAIWL